MNSEELQQLAERIARVIQERAWLPPPVRPDPPQGPTPGQLPAWAASAQSLYDVAPGKNRALSGRRPAYDALTAAARGAAAGRAPSPLPGGSAQSPRSGSSRTVPIAVSNRHMHITQAHFETLFGAGKRPTPDRPISQPGQFAAVERVRVVGPKGDIDTIRVVGPTRAATQVELSQTDCRKLGIHAPIRSSGSVQGSSALRLEGPAGSVELSEGAIVAARHMHLSPADAQSLGLAGGDRVTIALGVGDRSATLQDVLVRAGEAHATEIHLDTDEASAFGVSDGDKATILGKSGRTAGRATTGRRLVTERDVAAIAARGETLSRGEKCVVTPAARDRAKALGIWRETRE